MGDIDESAIGRCRNCDATHDRPFVTCPDCGDWLNERRFYA